MDRMADPFRLTNVVCNGAFGRSHATMMPRKLDDGRAVLFLLLMRIVSLRRQVNSVIARIETTRISLSEADLFGVSVLKNIEVSWPSGSRTARRGTVVARLTLTEAVRSNPSL